MTELSAPEEVGSTPKVSVVIPTYNMGRFVGSAIESVLEDSYDNVEILVVDDGSVDDTAEVVSRFTDRSSSRFDERVRYLQQANAGKSTAVNFGMSLAGGEYLTVMDADDLLPPDSLSVRVDVLEHSSGSVSDVAIGAFSVFDDEKAYGTRPAPDETDPAKLHDRFYLAWRIPFHLNACLMRRSLVERVGGYDPYVRRCVDGDYALRMLAEARAVTVVPDVVYRYRKHRSAASDRVSYRLRTAWDRPKVVWRNYRGWRRALGIPYGVLMDGCKLVYELVDNYKG